MILTDEELREAWEEPIKGITDGHELFTAIQDQRGERAIEKAVLRKVVEWEEELCKGHYMEKWAKHFSGCAPRRLCELCWQQLRKEAGL